ncbi:MAG: PAS domain S-box protein [Bacteroidota bacterium]
MKKESDNINIDSKGTVNFVLVFVIACILVIAGGYIFYYHQKVNERREIQLHLSTIADYKTKEIERWLSDNFYQGIAIFFNRHFVGHFNDWQQDRNNETRKHEILSLLEYEQKNKKLRAAFISDTEGNTILSSNNKNVVFDAHELNYLRKAVTDQAPVFTDLYRCEIDNEIHIATYIPLVQKINNISTVIAVVVLDIDPYTTLYPLIQKWPQKSETSEAQIVRKEGNYALFLNELRFAKRSALKLRIPLSQKDVPAVMAANNIVGIVEGKDYRGEDVLAVIKKISRSDWYLISKVDKKEIYQPITEKSLFITALIITLLMLIIITAFYYSKKAKTDYYKKLYESEKEKLLIKKSHDELINHANDIILLTDSSGKILEANKKAVTTYGYTLQELKKLNIKNLHPKETQSKFEIENAKTKTGDGNIYETTHITKSGKNVPVEVSSIFIVINDTGYVQSIIRDISERKYAEEKIRQTTKLLENIIDGTQDAIFIKDKDGKYILVNKAASEFVDKPAKEIIGKDDSFLFTEGLDSILENDHKVLREGVTIKSEETLVSGGVKKTFDVLKFPWKDSNNNIIGIIGIDRDITEKREMVERLRQSENHYRNLFNNNPHPMWVYDLNTLQFLEVNDAAVDHYGYSREEFLKMTIKDIRPKEDIEKLLENVHNSDKQPSNYIDHSGTWKHVKKDGTIIDVDITSHQINYNGHGGKLVLVNDITERLAAERKLKESEEQYRRFFEEDLTGDYITSPDGQILMCNQAFVDILGCDSVEDLKNKNAYDFYLDKNERDKFIEKLKKNGKLILHENTLRACDGRIINVVENVLADFDDNGEIVKILGYMFDITARVKALESLKQSEERYKYLAENITDVVWIFDINSQKLSYISPSVKKLRGFTVEEALEQTIEEALAPESVKLVQELLPKRIASYLSGIPDEPQIDEIQEYRKDGSFVTTEVSTSLLGDEKTGLKILGVSRDITERKLAEEQKKLNEKRLESLIKINEYNPETENELLDYTLEEAINLTSSKIGFVYFYDETTKLLTLNSWSKDVMHQCAITEKQTVYELDKTGVWSEAIRQRKEIIVNDFQIVHPHKIDFPEGHAAIERFLTIPVILDEKIVAVVGVANKETDYDNSDVRQLKLLMNSAWKIVEKKRTEHEILTLSKAIEQSPASIVITDLDGKIEFVNKKFTEVTGYTVDEVKGRNPNLFQSGFTSKSTYKELWDTIKTGKIWSGELLNKKKNGNLYWENVVISPVKNKNVFKYIAVKLDITDQKKMLHELIEAKEKAERSDRLKSEFLAQVSHEIRTPLNAVLSYSNLLQDDLQERDISDENTKESLAGIQFAGKRIIRTIDLILNMSELNTGSYEIKPTNINLNKDILNHLTLEFQPLAKEKNIEFNLVKETVDDRVFGDEYSISQIFSNLIDNSIKYTSHGYVKIKLYHDNRYDLVVEIEDSGIGMSKEFMAVMFEPFSQEDQGYSRKFEGNGLGLALVKKYCELNNIKIDVESEKGKGTTFRLTFPIKNS